MGKGSVAPAPETMERLEMDPGSSVYHEMPDGWKLHAETWRPSVEARAVLLHSHGWQESTLTLGVRRLAHACRSRGIILVAYDVHAHGLSLEKGGVKLPEAKRGCIDSVDAVAAHMAEMTKIVVREHKLPLIVMAHSLTASALVFATGRIVDAVKAGDGKLACLVYLAPPPAGLSPPCCPDCCFTACCPMLCACCSCPAPAAISPGCNPGSVLGGERNATKIYPANLLPNMCLAPTASDGTRPKSEAARLAAYVRELSGVAGRIFAGSKDAETVSPKRFAELTRKLPSPMSTEMIDGAIHDMLSTDPQALDNIDKIFAYVEERLAAAA